jgi:hypothetical protein
MQCVLLVEVITWHQRDVLLDFVHKLHLWVNDEFNQPQPAIPSSSTCCRLSTNVSIVAAAAFSL